MRARRAEVGGSPCWSHLGRKAAIKFYSGPTEQCRMKSPVAGRSGAPPAECVRADATAAASAPPDPIAAVAAHRAMNSVAFVAGALAALQEGPALLPGERQQLLARAMTHTSVIRALLYDLVLGLPLGASAVADHDPLLQAQRRFGVQAGSGPAGDGRSG